MSFLDISSRAVLWKQLEAYLELNGAKIIEEAQTWVGFAKIEEFAFETRII